MTLGDAGPSLARQPWAFAAVCVMTASLTLLVFGLSQVPVLQLLPWYVIAYLLIGACIFVPTGKPPSLQQAAAFLLPGALLVVLALLNLGLWAGGWLLGLPAWGLLLTRWTLKNRPHVLLVLKFLGVLVLGLLIFTLNMLWGIFSSGLFLLPIIPTVRLAFLGYSPRAFQAAVEVFLGLVVVVLAFTLPPPEGSWSSPWTDAGGAATAGLLIVFWVHRLPRRSRHLQPNDGAGF